MCDIVGIACEHDRAVRQRNGHHDRVDHIIGAGLATQDTGRLRQLETDRDDFTALHKSPELDLTAAIAPHLRDHNGGNEEPPTLVDREVVYRPHAPVVVVDRYQGTGV